jgi:hypothetical protein
MRNELLNTAHKNERAETAAFAVLGLAALFAIGEAFADSDPLGFSVLRANNLAVGMIDWVGVGFADEVSPGHYEFIDTTPDSSQRFYAVRSP